MTTNFEIFENTVNTLASSQGFYSRLQADMNDWTTEERANATKVINDLPQWHDVVDCILWLEQ